MSSLVSRVKVTSRAPSFMVVFSAAVSVTVAVTSLADSTIWVGSVPLRALSPSVMVNLTAPAFG